MHIALGSGSGWRPACVHMGYACTWTGLFLTCSGGEGGGWKCNKGASNTPAPQWEYGARQQVMVEVKVELRVEVKVQVEVKVEVGVEVMVEVKVEVKVKVKVEVKVKVKAKTKVKVTLASTFS